MTFYEICIWLDGLPQAAFVVMHTECTLNIIISSNFADFEHEIKKCLQKIYDAYPMHTQQLGSWTIFQKASNLLTFIISTQLFIRVIHSPKTEYDDYQENN